MRVGVEVGGTFTDLVAIDEKGILVTKVPSVPTAPDEGAFNALIESGIALSSIEDLAHGSTVATNAVLERKGGPIAFVVTEGFRDLLAMQRHNKRNIYDLRYQKPTPVVERKDSFEVNERIDGAGTIVHPLDEEAVIQNLIPLLKERGYAAVAICLLNAYTNPAHEQRLAELIRNHIDEILVTPSHEVTREFREFERASTTTISTYVQPVIDRYIRRFEIRLKENGFNGHFSIMQSNGGRLPAQGMLRNAISALLSGPAAGVMGAVRQAGRSSYKNLITLDMGGTSTDVCLIAEGKPQLTTEFEIDGLPIRTPVLDINTVGAGGGSLIWIDEGGMLRVGPRSAGADPGPACYGRGGKQATVTDAHIIRGTIRPEAFLGGRMEIDVAASEAVLRPIARKLGMSLDETAESAIRVANANIVRAIQIVSTQRGNDPRDYTLVSFGGAGGLHAPQIAEDLGIDKIIIPPNAGVLSAYGLIASDYIQFESLTKRILLDGDAVLSFRKVYEELEKRSLERFQELGLKGNFKMTLIADARFVGQAFEVPVEMTREEVLSSTVEKLRDMFAQAHHRIFFHGADTKGAVEMVSFRLKSVASLTNVPLLHEESGSDLGGIVDHVIFDGGERHQARALSRSTLEVGKEMQGPLLLEDSTSTTFVPIRWTAALDGEDNVIIRRI